MFSNILVIVLTVLGILPWLPAVFPSLAVTTPLGRVLYAFFVMATGIGAIVALRLERREATREQVLRDVTTAAMAKEQGAIAEDLSKLVGYIKTDLKERETVRAMLPASGASPSYSLAQALDRQIALDRDLLDKAGQFEHWHYYGAKVSGPHGGARIAESKAAVLSDREGKPIGGA